MIEKICRLIIFSLVTVIVPAISFSQKVYFADGYHGGVYGHYPPWYTRFMVDKLNQNPDWVINIELEPETWDTAQVKDPEALKEFQQLFENQSANGRIEYVNPSYGQSYFYNISGESIIRQFQYGIEKVNQHFPSAVFTTYSSEEPCFTTALPQILKSFGFKYAVLKNPNTCWGGYTRAFGGELVNWIGPDGTTMPTVPRYEIESLQPNSTWQTIAWSTSNKYVNAAFDYGIKHPVGMCLQDAGWQYGPWLDTLNGRGDRYAQYVLWKDYFGNIAIQNANQDWRVSQEDMLVSLVWGAQVLQKIAQQVRTAENKIVTAEKLASIAKLYKDVTYPTDTLREAWRTLLLSQHHDCWIVPYNGRPGNTWADKVERWTGYTLTKSENFIDQSVSALSSKSTEKNDEYIRVFNTLASARKELVSADIPDDFNTSEIKLSDKNKKAVMYQVVTDSSGKEQIIFKADVPSVGYTTYSVAKGISSQTSTGASVSEQQDGTYKLETDFYEITIDPAKGGIIKSLIAKKMNNHEFADSNNERSLNELRGNFYEEDGFRSSTENAASVKVIENGPLRIKLKIEGTIASHPFTQMLSLVQGEPRIDVNLRINWNGNPAIGDNFKPDSSYKALDLRKGFYNDTSKLLALFPLNIENQKVYKDAPFDVTESKLQNTFFTRWDSIKNNIIFNWVDVTDASNKYGFAVLTDHTTSYVHGDDYPLALDIQFSGRGLWGRNYKLIQPTEINYALIPHTGKWNEANLPTETTKWNEPLITKINAGTSAVNTKSLITLSGKGWELTALTFENNDLLARLYNAEGKNNSQKIIFDCKAEKAELAELNGTTTQTLKSEYKNGKTSVQVTIPPYGFRTIRLVNVQKK